MKLLKTLTIMSAACSAMMLFACSDSGEGGPCVGHGCETVQPYGGEVILEHIVPPNGTEVRRITAFFVESTTQGGDDSHKPIPEPGVSGTTPTCTNFRTTVSWPAPGDGHAGETALDLGESVTMTGADGTEYVLSRNADTADADGRMHDFVYTYIEPFTDGDTIPNVEFNQNWTLEIDNGDGSMYEQALEEGVFHPSRFDMVSPPMTGAFEITTGSDLEVEWDALNVDATRFGAEQLDVLVAFVEPMDADGDGVAGLHTLCLGPQADGFMNVPSAVLDSVPEAGAVMLVGHVAHNQTLSAAERLVHQIGRTCYVSPYTTVAP